MTRKHTVGKRWLVKICYADSVSGDKNHSPLPWKMGAPLKNEIYPAFLKIEGRQRVLPVFAISQFPSVRNMPPLAHFGAVYPNPLPVQKNIKIKTP